MASKNTIREFIPEAYYHVYNRGVEKRLIFLDDKDYTVFLNLLKRYLTGEDDHPANRHKLDNLSGQLHLLAYCLMPNHFHLLFYQEDEEAITRLMRRLSTSYAMYFNNRYGRVGSLFQGRYKASQVTTDPYLYHISRYIHLNPDDYKKWPYSSYDCYIGNKKTKWVNTKPILDLFEGGEKEYAKFVADYVDIRNDLTLLKYQLADNPED